MVPLIFVTNDFWLIDRILLVDNMKFGADKKDLSLKRRHGGQTRSKTCTISRKIPIRQ